MKMNEAFPSNYLKSDDFAEGEEKTATITHVSLKKMKDNQGQEEDKPVVSFAEIKPIVLNVTNWKRIAQITGEEDTDNWAGKKITLMTEMVDSFGEIKPAIRVKLVSAKQAAVTAFWTKANELGYSREDALKILAKHNQDFATAINDLMF
jgi:NACalpha-BTF3-like transcription factor